MISYACGCRNEVHPATGALRSVAKCAAHQRARREAAGLGQAYYQELGTIRDGIPQCALLLGQMREALGEFPKANPGDRALEVGCGVSMYAPGLLRAGYVYTGLDPSAWGCAWTSSAFDVKTVVGTLESAILGMDRYDLILAAHCLEHMADAPWAIRRCADMLRAGGESWIVVPDDEDPVNPDHLWNFQEASLRASLEAAGLVVDRLEIRRHVAHENFLYAVARKP